MSRVDVRERERASARLGSRLRSVLAAPSEGFPPTFRACDRRVRAGGHPAEGYAPFVLAALGGASLFVLWLKVGGALGLREAGHSLYRTEFMVAAMVVGALLSLLTQGLWGMAGVPAARLLGGRARPCDLRMVWGIAACPNVLALVLLPLDFAIVGPDSFTTAPLGDTLALGWAALSTAFALALAVWALWLLIRGVQTAMGLTLGRALWGTAGAFSCLGVVVALAVVAANAAQTSL